MTRRTRASAPRKAPAAAPVRTRKAHPLAWRRAIALARGDASRLEILEDGSVLVQNR